MMTDLVPSRSSATSSYKEKRDPVFQRVTRSFLRSLTSDPLGSITLLDLSGCGLKRISGLAACPNIEIVIANDNEIDTLIDLSGCRQLWKLDVSNNELRDLCGLEKFTTFGTLIVSYNQLSWIELAKISHLELLNLFLCGNDKLERDENYRKHVIKCLPKVWSLDGELVSSEERRSVDSFFDKAAKSKKPVRLKLPRHHFIPSFRKQGCCSVIHGKRTADLCKYFGRNEIHSRTLDHRRLQYLCTNFYTDFVLESCSEISCDFLKECLKIKDESNGKWNMFVLLIVSSLVFSIPKSLMISTLQVIGMTDVELAMCDTILKLPCQVRTNLSSLLFSFIKLDGFGKGIASQLYNTMRSLNNKLIKVAYGVNDIELGAQDQHILAAELVQIFCLVPQLSSYLGDENVITILISATFNNDIEIEARQLLYECDEYQAKENLVEFITLQIQEAKETSYFAYDTFYSDIAQSPTLGISVPYLNMKVSRKTRPSTAPPSLARLKVKKAPSVGDKVLLGPQRLGHIVSKPDVRVVLVQVDSLSSSRYLQADFIEPIHNQHSLFYVKKCDLDWDERFHSWIFSSRYQPTKIPINIKHSSFSPRILGTRNLALYKEPSQVIKRSRTLANVEEEELVTLTGAISSDILSTSKVDTKLSQGKKGPEENFYTMHSNDSQHLDIDIGHKGVKYVDPHSEGADDKYIPVFQSNACHLYYTDKTRYTMPTIKHPALQRPIDIRKTNRAFIRKSNWMGCLA